MEDEILFISGYIELKESFRYGLGTASNEDVSSILISLSNKIESTAYTTSGIKLEPIDKFVNGLNGKGLNDLIKFLEPMKPEDLKKIYLDSAGKPTLVLVAESYFFNRLLTKFGITFKLNIPSKLKSEKEPSENRIAFIGKYKDWKAVKKQKLEKAENWEISAILCGINNTCVNKSFDFVNLTNEFGKARKSLTTLVAALKNLTLPADPKEQTYLVCKTFESSGYRLFASPEMLVKEYPDVKPPKPRGRMKKG